MKIKPKAFTLIELLVTIVIIGILATISVRTFNGYQKRAREAVVKADLKPLIDAINIARLLEEKTLQEITGSGCSGCQCPSDSKLYNLPPTHNCFTRWETTVNKIAESANIKLKTPFLDPWGSPYRLDENEGEQSANYCRRDHIRSHGPDGLHSGDDISLDIITFYDNKQCGR